MASPRFIEHAAQSHDKETESSCKPVAIETKHPFFSDLSSDGPHSSGYTPQGRAGRCHLNPFADSAGRRANVPRWRFAANGSGRAAIGKRLGPGYAAVERKWRDLPRLRSLIWINATAVELRLRETLAQVLKERLLEGGVAEIAKAIGSKKAYPVFANGRAQK